MSPKARLSLIKSIAHKIGYGSIGALPGLMPLSQVEIEHTVNSIVRHEQPHSILDDEMEGVNPTIHRSFERVVEKPDKEDGTLAANQRAQLERDVARARHRMVATVGIADPMQEVRAASARFCAGVAN